MEQDQENEIVEVTPDNLESLIDDFAGMDLDAMKVRQIARVQEEHNAR